MQYIVYGLPNCDVTKKALTWLDAHGVSYKLHNYKTEGITAGKLQEWCKQKGWETLLNKRGTTFKGLHPAIQQNAVNEKAAIEIMEARTSTIKRPVIEKGDKVVAVGFDERKYEIVF
jgi:Spx/MgsR family transcriptional regulator